MEKNQAVKTKSSSSIFAFIAIPLIIVICHIIFHVVMGDPQNFEGGDTANHPVDEGFRKWLGTIFKGGVIVPFLMSFFMMVFTFSIERLISLSKASGTSSVDAFVRNVKTLLSQNKVDEAIAACDKQKGSVGNVIQAVLHKYKDMLKETEMTKDQKSLAIQKELEDATSLELPMLEKNLTIIATLASTSTLVGLLGTVLGMIKAFSALATAGAPDAAALSTGISEALINTALGIGGSAFAIMFYNYFTSKIDTLTYNIDEVGFSIIANFGAVSK
jgi:biopolymer transport protein ExbB